MSFAVIGAWVRANIIPLLILVAVLVAAGWFALSQWQHAHTAKAETSLAQQQGTAAIQSGADAVSTVGNEQARETDIHSTVKEATDAIAQAPAGNSNDAADRAACELRSYRHQPRCVALLGPVAQ